MTGAEDCLRQAAALAVFKGKVCLVTSSSGRRWVLPKGMIEPKDTILGAVAREAWEEAGVLGEVLDEPLGWYRTTKWSEPCIVIVHGLRVTRVRSRWPERSRRQRLFVSAGEAAERVDIPALQDIILSTARHEGLYLPRPSLPLV